MPDAGCIEKAHLVEALLEAFARPRPPASLSLRSIAQPTQCAICMSAFKEGDLLRQQLRCTRGWSNDDTVRRPGLVKVSGLSLPCKHSSGGERARQWNFVQVALE